MSMILASEIIKRCGGFKAVADHLGMDRSGVQRWTYDTTKGTGDRIPTQHWAAIILLARQNGLEIDLQDLAPPEAVEAANASAPQTGAAA